MDVKAAIEFGDSDALTALLAEDASRANQLIAWGRNHTHPLHYISDMLFDGTLERGKELPLVDVLLAAGADPNHQATNGETPLIGAASLGAEAVGLRLIEAGARVNMTGAFTETTLHWAAHVGLPRLVQRLIENGADVNLRDGRYHSSPLGWALHGQSQSPANDGRHAEVIALLVSAGATDPLTQT
jgi:ankyrin repeat protein